MRNLLSLVSTAFLSLSFGQPVLADTSAQALRVATDIPPVHSLVAQVMGDLGTVDLVMRPGASPHSYAMRPSEAAALAGADVVFWIGEPLTPWLGKSLSTLATDARVVELLDVAGTTTLAFREGVTFEHDEHDDEEVGAHNDDDHDSDDHEEEEHHDHHEGVDPHAWLDPENGKIWLDAIAAELGQLDPVNAAQYRQNAMTAKAELEGLIAGIHARLEPHSEARFVVFHDAYHYFENRFGVSALGAISLGDASDPSPSRIVQIRQAVVDANVSCVFAEPQFNTDLITAVTEGTQARTALIDPLGVGIETGAAHYKKTLSQITDSMVACF
jgi:zinc transport system substrate-binding protein